MRTITDIGEWEGNILAVIIAGQVTVSGWPHLGSLEAVSDHEESITTWIVQDDSMQSRKLRFHSGRNPRSAERLLLDLTRIYHHC